MGAGSFARAVRYTGGIDPVINTFKGIMDKKAQQDYYDNLLNAYNQSQQNQQQVGTPALPVQSVSNTPPNPLSTLGQPGQNVMNNLNPLPMQNNAGPEIQTMPNAEVPINTVNRPNVQSNFNQIQSPQNYQKAQDVTNDFTAEQLLNAVQTPGVNPNIVNVLSGLLQNNADRYKPTPDTWKEIPSGGMLQGFSGQTGQPTTNKIINPKEVDPNIDKKINEIIGKRDNQPYGTFQRPDGTIYTKNMITNQLAPANIEARDPSDGSAVAWAALFNSMNKDKNKETEVKGTAQDKYNAVMGSPYVKMSDLVDQGIEDNPPLNADGSYKYGGAYVTRDKAGKTHVIYNDEMLTNFAKNQVPDAPNKWDRTKAQNNNPTPNAQTPAVNSQVPQKAIDFLTSHPELKSKFDEKYGQGSSDKYLQGK